MSLTSKMSSNSIVDTAMRPDLASQRRLASLASLQEQLELKNKTILYLRSLGWATFRNSLRADNKNGVAVCSRCTDHVCDSGKRNCGALLKNYNCSIYQVIFFGGGWIFFLKKLFKNFEVSFWLMH